MSAPLLTTDDWLLTTMLFMEYQVAGLCQSCGNPIELTGLSICPNCQAQGVSVSTAVPPERESETNRPPWGLAVAIVMWALFTLSIFIVPFISILIWAQVKGVTIGRSGEGILNNPEAILVSIAAVSVAHALMILLGLGVVTGGWTRRFSKAVGWSWHPRFKLRHAMVTVLLLYAVTFLLSNVLPSAETDFDKMLKISQAVRIVIAVLAVVTAPLIEELVYRGILYPAVHAKFGRTTAIGVVGALFALVHFPQYGGSTLILVSITLLSFVLTGVRAFTGRLLPCYVVHLLYNTVGAMLILMDYATISPWELTFLARIR